ncbi:MAG: hypothetical protein AAB263_12445 [Planctomycetota bacterium]
MWWVLRTYIWYAGLIIGLGFAARYLPGYLNHLAIDIEYDRDCSEVELGSTYWLTKAPWRSGSIVAYHVGKNAEVIGFGRLVAYPGATLEWQAGNLLVDGALVRGWRPANQFRGNLDLGPLRLPAGYVYVISDGHRRDSVELGPIPIEAIIGGIRE